MKSIVFQAVCLGVLALSFLAEGLRGVITKKPFIVSGRWLFITIAIGQAPMLAVFVEDLLPGAHGLPWYQSAGFLLLWAGFLVFIWQQMSGYVVIGVTDESLRNSLHHSLNKLNIPFEESLSRLRLPSLEADLQVSAQSWMGSAMIRLKPKRQRAILKQIVAEMSTYFSQTSVRTNLYTCVFYAVAGVMMLVLGTMLTYWRLSLHAEMQALRDYVPR